MRTPARAGYSGVLSCAYFNGLRKTLRLFERRTGESTDSPAVYSITDSFYFIFIFHLSVLYVFTCLC
jgi:hypothetical protein